MSFVISVCLSFCPSHHLSSVCMDQLDSLWFSTYLIIWVFFSGKSVEKIQHSVKSDKNSGYFTWEMFQTKIVQNMATHILCPITFFFLENLSFSLDSVEIYSTAGQATDDNMAHAHCMLDSYGYKYIHRFCDTHCSSIGPMVAQTRLRVTSYVRTLPTL
jgi:hypothetical protein